MIILLGETIYILFNVVRDRWRLHSVWNKLGRASFVAGIWLNDDNETSSDYQFR